MSKYLEKFSRIRKIINENGGILGTYMKLYKTDELKIGTLVGEDKFGNKYYQNKMYFMGRSRWVEYSPAVHLDYDGSQVPPEWHRWLHYIGDESPVEKKPETKGWMSEHYENTTASSNEYVPYSTARPKVEAWVPPKN